MKRVLVLASTVALVGCSDPEPIAVPDLVGMQLDAARESVEDLELEEVDASGADRGVWSSSNWIVQDQDPSAGETVEPGATVTVQVVNVRDEDEEEGDEPQEDERQVERQEAAETEEPPAEQPETDIEADVMARPSGLTIRPEQSWGTAGWTSTAALSGPATRPGSRNFRPVRRPSCLTRS
jgi:beta-lactam-binding protein with PASTA domain